MLTRPFNRALAYKLSLCVLSASLEWAQTSQGSLKSERNPTKRAALALTLADSALTNASNSYRNGDVHQGDAELDEMTSDLKECVAALQDAHKRVNYKKAELRVASIQRRLQDIVDEISLQNRGWAEQTERTVDGIHDRLLSGVMKK